MILLSCLKDLLREDAMKVFSVSYNEDERLNTNEILNKIYSSLMRRIQTIIFSKIERHLLMLSYDTPKAAIKRDEYIRFDNTYGEIPDD